MPHFKPFLNAEFCGMPFIGMPFKRTKKRLINSMVHPNKCRLPFWVGAAKNCLLKAGVK